MKTTITIPHKLFRAAESAARCLGVSRNELYARALKEFLGRERDEDITQRLNDVYAKEPARIDSVLAQMQFASLPPDSKFLTTDN
ncbi:MAG: hypothetical protein WD894_02355 [Pirellulales bacterium]